MLLHGVDGSSILQRGTKFLRAATYLNVRPNGRKLESRVAGSIPYAWWQQLEICSDKGEPLNLGCCSKKFICSHSLMVECDFGKVEMEVRFFLGAPGYVFAKYLNGGYYAKSRQQKIPLHL